MFARGNSRTKSLIFALVVLGAATPAFAYGDSCDVAHMLAKVEPPDGTLALTGFGQVEEVNALLTPTTIKIGTYEVVVTREGDDLYAVQGTELFIRTRYCYQYAYAERAVLRYSSSGGFSKGRLVFVN
jgi:uncharacterized protein YbjT (DUF2867 family)